MLETLIRSQKDKMPPFFPGTIVLLVVIMFSFGLTLSMRSFQFEQLIRKDDRLRRIMEAVTHLKIIKLMNWEETFDNQVDELRAKELASIRMFLTLQVHSRGGRVVTDIAANFFVRSLRL